VSSTRRQIFVVSVLLIVNRAAEVSTGLICVCVPTLAALAQSRGPLKPTHSIVNGQSNINTRRSARRQSSLDYLDKIEMLPNQGKLKMPIGVVTGIEGGVHRREKEDGERYGSIDASGDEEVGGEAKGIMTTVRIEQTYV